MKTRLIAMVAILAVCAAVAFAQTSRGTVTGTIADANGAVISGATVTLIDSKKGVERSTTTNSDGVYRFDAVDLGNYSVKISAAGFGEVTKTNLEVRANQTSEVGATMAPAGQQVTVDVTAESGVLLQTEAPVRGGGPGAGGPLSSVAANSPVTILNFFNDEVQIAPCAFGHAFHIIRLPGVPLLVTCNNFAILLTHAVTIADALPDINRGWIIAILFKGWRRCGRYRCYGSD